MPTAKSRTTLAAIAAALLTAACGGAGAQQSAADVGSGQLQGAGATFPEPFYSRAFYAYNQEHSQVSVNYQAIGSGGGIQQFTKSTVDFGASDVPMSPAEVQAAGGAGTLVQLPSIVGVAAVAYNLPGVDRLQLDGPTLAKIFLGQVRTWNDPALRELNPGVKLPAQDITVVHRSDGSGTSYAFTDYLSKLSPEWASRVGRGKSVQWPAGVGGNGNEGVGQAVKSTPGAVGYVELAYVLQSRLQMAYLKNRAGRYLQASLQGATAAAAGLSGLNPANFSITDAAGAEAYPIATYSWIILRTQQKDLARARADVYLWRWMIGDGQRYAAQLQYASLPADARQYALSRLREVQVNGKPVLS